MFNADHMGSPQPLTIKKTFSGFNQTVTLRGPESINLLSAPLVNKLTKFCPSKEKGSENVRKMSTSEKT